MKKTMNLRLLQRGGEVAYFGDMGPSDRYVRGDGQEVEFSTSGHLTEHMEKQIPGLKKPPAKNPAEFMLEVLMGAKNKYSHLDGGKSSEEQADDAENGDNTTSKKDIDFAVRFRESDMFKNDIEKVESLNATQGDKLTSDSRYGASFYMQTVENTKRWWVMLLRDNGLNLTRILVVTAMALLIGGILFRARIEGDRGLQIFISKNGVLFASTFFVGIVQGIMIIPVLANSKAAYYRERASLTYSTATFLIGRSIVEVFWVMVCITIWMCSLYPMAALDSDVGIIIFTYIAEIIFVLMLVNMAELFSVCLPSAGAAESMYATAGGVLNLYAGYFLPVQQIPWPWKVLYYSCPARFGVQALTPWQFWCSHSCLADNPGGSTSVHEKQLFFRFKVDRFMIVYSITMSLFRCSFRKNPSNVSCSFNFTFRFLLRLMVVLRTDAKPIFARTEKKLIGLELLARDIS